MVKCMDELREGYDRLFKCAEGAGQKYIEVLVMEVIYGK